MRTPTSPHPARSTTTITGGKSHQSGRATPDDSSAHGPTSALFDDPSQSRFELEASGSGISESVLRDQATTRAAEERHLEILNLAAGKLDCESWSCPPRDPTQLTTVDGVPADLAIHLLALHWNRQHYAFLISYRPRGCGCLLH